MKKTKTKEKKLILKMILGLLFFATGIPSGEALCLKECQQKTEIKSTPKITYQDSSERFQSHNMGDVRNSIIGDTHIQNGHEKIEIKDIHAQESMIDASINSTIILGDMQK